jgi:thioredoxin reductase (NADPH)
VLTGDDAGTGKLPLETCRSGIFAVGDVRSGSVKRVAASVGDGAAAVASIHAYLGKQQELAPRFVMTSAPAAMA